MNKQEKKNLIVELTEKLKNQRLSNYRVDFEKSEKLLNEYGFYEFLIEHPELSIEELDELIKSKPIALRSIKQSRKDSDDFYEDFKLFGKDYLEEQRRLKSVHNQIFSSAKVTIPDDND